MDWSKALSWGRLLHLSQKQRRGALSDREVAEMAQLRRQQRQLNARSRRSFRPLVNDWTRL